MTEPPETLDGARVLAWAWSGESPFGEMPVLGEGGIEIYGLAICRYDGSGVYRFSCDRAWCVQNDAPYDDVETAKRSIPAQYVGRAPIVWVDRPA